MKPLTKEWVKKAEGDFITAGREYRARKLPNYDSACFHSQQCVEKYFKARLQESSIVFSKTHDLESLLTMCIAIEPLWAVHAKSDIEQVRRSIQISRRQCNKETGEGCSGTMQRHPVVCPLEPWTQSLTSYNVGMASYTQSIQNLMNELSRLPGIGMRSAERIAFHLLKQNPAEAMKLADSGCEAEQVQESA